nr:MAG TPA: hypothetical protein [Herelleviridae sp.]DAI68803.1 MAG TPA: hypothetical protein [Caudoviricetes sp.]DAG93625.1 MAG TPA: hypothetical protein [Herelleviridae sp.]DAN61609.1 MAG TPA: hypothetical protein [Caudoviricetes sp.]DAP04872.1 MAG TPA: hypothetical protein [Caudoviricetes sp.]
MLIPVHPGIGNRYVRVILHDLIFFANIINPPDNHLCGGF